MRTSDCRIREASHPFIVGRRIPQFGFFTLLLELGNFCHESVDLSFESMDSIQLALAVGLM